MTQRGRLRLGLGIAAAVLAADQMAKQFVLHDADLAQRFGGPLLPGLLDLTLVRNHGVTFGLLQAGSFWGEMLLSAIAIAVVAALLLWLRRAEHDGAVAEVEHVGERKRSATSPTASVSAKSRISCTCIGAAGTPSPTCSTSATAPSCSASRPCCSRGP